MNTELRMPPYTRKFRIAYNGHGTYYVIDRETDETVSYHHSASEARDIAKALYAQANP